MFPDRPRINFHKTLFDLFRNPRKNPYCGMHDKKLSIRRPPKGVSTRENIGFGRTGWRAAHPNPPSRVPGGKAYYRHRCTNGPFAQRLHGSLCRLRRLQKGKLPQAASNFCFFAPHALPCTWVNGILYKILGFSGTGPVYHRGRGAGNRQTHLFVYKNRQFRLNV